MRGFIKSSLSPWLALSLALAMSAPLAGAAFPPGASRITVSGPLVTHIARSPRSPYADVPSVAESFMAYADVTSQAGTLTAQGVVRVIAHVGQTPGGLTIVRVAGRSRYDTAIAASQRAFPGGAPAVVLATGANWPDALGGSALAGACDAPLLLTLKASLPDSVRAEIRRLGATKVYILGGTAAVGAAVEVSLVSMLGRNSVVRLGGQNRYETGRLVADETISVLGGAYSGDALVATGGNFPDATAGAAVAAALGRPILLARPGTSDVYVPMATRRVLILGGPAAVSGATERALVSRLGGGSVSRAGGGNRYATAVLIARAGVAAGMSWDGLGLATGTDYPDALSGGAMLGAHNSVMMLTRPTELSSETEAVLAEQRASIHTLYIFGGPRAVSQDVEDAVRAVIVGP